MRLSIACACQIVSIETIVGADPLYSTEGRSHQYDPETVRVEQRPGGKNVFTNQPDRNPYGLKQSHQTLDKDDLKTYVTQMAGTEPNRVLEQSEIEDILDDFERTMGRGIYIDDRDVLEVSQLTGAGLVQALEKSINESNSERGNLVDANGRPILTRRTNPYSRAMDQRLGTGRAEDQQVVKKSLQQMGFPYGQTRGLQNSSSSDPSTTAAYNTNGSQRDNGINGDMTGKFASHFSGQRKIASSYEEQQKQIERDRQIYPDMPTQRELVEMSAEAYSNGAPRFDAAGNKIYPNGKRKESDSGTPLFANGRPKLDSSGNELHSNGRRRKSDSGLKLYANGRPMVTAEGVHLFPDGKRRFAGDGKASLVYTPRNPEDYTPTLNTAGQRTDTATSIDKYRALYANGQRQVTDKGAELHPNAKPKASGDGVAVINDYNRNPDLTFTGTGSPNPSSFAAELYSNSKKGTNENSDRFFSNGQERTNDKGEFLFPNGRKLVNDANVALTPSGSQVVSTIGPQRRAQGEFKLFDILHGTVVKNDSKWLEIKPKGQTDTIKVSVDRAKIGRSSATSPAVPGSIDEVGAQAAVEIIVTGNHRFVDGQEVERSDSNQAVAVLTSSPRVGTQPVKSNKRQVVEVVAGRVRNYADNVLHLEVNGGKTESVNIANAVYQKHGSEGPVPVDANVLLRAGARVDVVVNRTYEYENGKPVKQLQPTALALMGK